MLAAFLLVLARRPEAILVPEFNWEEASAFYVPTFFLDPLAQLLEPWGGTLQVVPRVAYLTLRPVPVAWAPLVENLLAAAALVALAVFVASRRLESIVPDRRVRIVLAGALLVLPAQRDVIGALMNVQWYGGLWLMLLPMATRPTSLAGRWIERAVAGAVALTGPFSLLLTPVFLWRLRNSPDRHDLWLAVIVAIGGLIQLFLIFGSGRPEIVEQRPIGMAFVSYVLHVAIVPVLGERLSAGIASIGAPAPLLFVGGVALAAALLLTAARALPAGLLPLVYGALIVGASGIAIHGGANVWPPGSYERYFLAASFLVIAVVVAGVRRRNRLAYILALLLAAGIVTDFRLEPYPAQGWAETHSCIGSTEECVIPVWPHDYDVRWPGAEGTYQMPDHVDP